jgi:hypothetical protein
MLDPADADGAIDALDVSAAAVSHVVWFEEQARSRGRVPRSPIAVMVRDCTTLAVHEVTAVIRDDDASISFAQRVHVETIRPLPMTYLPPLPRGWIWTVAVRGGQRYADAFYPTTGMRVWASHEQTLGDADPVPHIYVDRGSDDGGDDARVLAAVAAVALRRSVYVDPSSVDAFLGGSK